MPRMYIDKSILIDKHAVDIYSKVADFHNWTKWSPWAVLDRETKEEVSGNGKYFEWDGPIVGAGNMNILSETENEQLEIDLNFVKPWRSHAKVHFSFVPEGEGTRVHWKMESKLPFFLFFLKKMMSAYVGLDFNRGLTMLKDLAETGKVHSQLTFKGFEQYPGCKFIGIKTLCNMDLVGERMSGDFGKLMGFMSDKKDMMDGHPFSIYHKWKPVKGLVGYTAAIPVKEIPANLPDGVYSGSVPATKVHTIHHKGPYRFIGNVWSAQYSRVRAKLFKLNRSVHPIEVYLNSPMDTAENNLESEVKMPVH